MPHNHHVNKFHRGGGKSLPALSALIGQPSSKLANTKRRHFRREKPTRIDRVVDNVFVGGEDWCNDRAIAELGFTHVVCIGSEGRHEAPGIKGVKLLVERMPDADNHYISKNDFNRVVDFIEDAMDDGGKLLIHCRMGMSRSVTFCAAYMIRAKGYTEEGAMREIKKRHPNAQPNPGFLEQLEAWSNWLFVEELGGADQDGNGIRDTRDSDSSDDSSSSDDSPTAGSSSTSTSGGD